MMRKVVSEREGGADQIFTLKQVGEKAKGVYRFYGSKEGCL